MRSVANFESRKRARSPSSPSPAERSSKRQLAIHPGFHGVGAVPFAAVPMHRMARGEDEWVDQTRELRIESPSLGSETSDFGASAARDEMEGLMREDIQMSNPMPADASMATSISQPASTPISEVFLHNVHSAGPQNLSFTPQYASPLIQATSLPVLDPTMSHTKPPLGTVQSSFNAGDQTIVDASVMIDTIGASSFISPPAPANVHVPPSTLSSPRRFMTGSDVTAKRVYIGYRADCEKCRQKVPGHWMHISGQDDCL